MNKFICNGRLTRDPEIKVTQNNTKLANISVAVRKNYKNVEGNYDSDFFNCTAFGNQAEFLEKYFKKGQEILISGHLQNRSWETESGEKRYATDIIVETIDFIGSKQNTDENKTTDLSGSGTTTINGNNITTGTISASREVEVTVKEDDNSDDLPF